MTHEQLFKTAQNYINTPGLPLLVLGSGASMAVGIPGMWELAQELKKIEIDEKEDKQCWTEFLSIIDNTDLESALLRTTLTDKMLNKVVLSTWTYINKLDLKIFNEMINGNDLPIVGLFKHLLSSSNKTLNIVTTNYDRLVEYAASIVNLYPFTYFNAGYFSSFIGEQDDCFTKAKGCTGLANICKLHGSLDWFNFSKPYTMHKAIPLQEKLPPNATPCIVTPGIEKYRKTSQTPFRELFHIADQQINEAPAYICIGYGFNDDHVHPKLLENITRNKKPLVVITKKLTSNAKAILELEGAEKILLIEEGGSDHCIVYTKEERKGCSFNEPFWDLRSFLNLLT